MKRNSLLMTLVGIVVLAAAIASLIIIFRDEIEYFIVGMRDKMTAAKQDLFTPDEYSDYADVE